MVIHWPKGFKAKGEVRSQWHHVIDIAPTILEAAGLPEPKAVNGITQTPIEGVSMLYTFGDANARDRHLTQYFEIFGNRAIYQRRLAGWYGSQGAVGTQTTGNPGKRHVGALRHPGRLQPGKRPVREEPREAQGDAGTVHEGSGQV